LSTETGVTVDLDAVDSRLGLKLEDFAAWYHARRGGAAAPPPS
jgi:hypothetical protein